MPRKVYRKNSNGVWEKVPARTTIKNTTDIPDDVIKSAVQFCRPPSISGFRVTVCKSQYDYCGWGHSGGIKLRIGTHCRYPRRLRVYQYGQLKGRRYYLGSMVEALIFLAAHELMHVRQGQVGPMRSRVWGARGRYSEIETDTYAIRKLREYRKGVN